MFIGEVIWGICNAMLIFALTGCHAPRSVAATQTISRSIAATMMSQQLMVKFKPNTIPCDPAGIAQLSSVTKLSLELVRPMSGGACVIRQLTGDTHDFLRGQERLRQHPDVEWLELDSKKKAL